MKKQQTNFNKAKKGFTLVELIIVITILAILATIAFVSFNSYTKNSRDGNRLTTVKNIEKGLELFYIKSSKYPMPDGEVISIGTASGAEITYKGIIGDDISRIINISKTPKDPLIDKEYIYGVSYDNKYIQIGALIEGNIAYQNIIPTAYAQNYTSHVLGNYGGFIKFSTGGQLYIANIPSLLYDSDAESIDLILDDIYYIVNKGTNLPHNMTDTESGKLPTQIIQDRYGEGADLMVINISNVTAGNLGDTFTGATLQSFGGELPFIETIVLGTSSISYNSCDGISHGSVKEFFVDNYQEDINNCVSESFSCNNGTWIGEANKESYPYASCSNFPPCIIGESLIGACSL